MVGDVAAATRFHQVDAAHRAFAVREQDVRALGRAAERDDRLVLEQEQRVGSATVVARLDERLHELVDRLVAPGAEPDRDE
jgi:hypothetical protein